MNEVLFQTNLDEKGNRRELLNYIRNSREMLEEAFNNGSSGKYLNNLITEQNDRIIKFLFKNYAPLNARICLIALGGYGRGEMAPYSDVDLMLLHEKKDGKIIENLMGKITYPLWDCGVEISGVSRTLKDCGKVASEDIRSLTSMMDGRFLIGDSDIYSRFETFVSKFIKKSSRRNKYIKSKIKEYEKRLKKYGDSVFVSEPHIKEGEGGLRCFHTALWISRALEGTRNLDQMRALDLLDQDSYNEIKTALDFLWRLRHGLHLNAGRKQDRLNYELQEILSEQMGFNEKDVRKGLEDFMHLFYSNASNIHRFSDRFIKRAISRSKVKRIRNRLVSKKLDDHIYRHGDDIHISSRADIGRNPEIAMKAWRYSHKLKLNLDGKSREQIKTATPFWKENIVSGNDNIRILFKDMIKDPVGLDAVLFEMHETGALNKFMPEFRSLYHKVQYDAYHIYTVDIHTIFLVRELSNLFSGKYRESYPHFHKAAEQVKRVDLLIMASLLHDIGKGDDGDERHDVSGAKIAKKVMQYFRYEEKDQNTVEFLVRSHLIMPQLAFCRDATDPHLIENFAASVKTSDHLRLLYLLTFADIRATGANVWSSWKGELLASIYSKTSDVLNGRGYTSKNIDEVIERKMADISQFVRENERDDLVTWLNDMPARYILSMSPPKIAAHFIAKQNLDHEPVKISVESDSNQSYHDLLIVTKDAPGLFAKICAVLSNNNISIIEAQIHTDKGGDVIDRFKVVGRSGKKIRSDFDWDEVSDNLKDAVQHMGEVKVSKEEPVSGRFTKKRFRKHGQRTDVLIDNDVSAYYTVIEIHAPDKVGLLHQVAYWLYDHGYDIYMAKALTHANQAIDVFYVKKRDGKKIESKEEAKQVREELIKCL